MTTPTNTDLMQTLGRIEEKVDNVDERLRFTNGKVAALMEDKIRREERDKMRNELPPIQRAENVTITPAITHWYDNKALVGYVGAAVAAAGAIAGFLVGGN